MANGFIEADRYDLSGEGASITYDLRSAELRYSGPTEPTQPDQVEVTETASPLDTPIGRLVTAVLRATADGDTNTVTVLLPRVILPQGEDEPPPEASIETVAVFTTTRSSIGGPKLVEGPIQLYTTAALSGTARRAGPAIPCRYSAVLTRELPGPGVLRVEGECTLPSTGYDITLVRQVPQGVNPRDLLLQLVVTPPPDISAPALTTYPVLYEEVTEVYLDTVTILPDGASVEVQIIT